MFSLNTFSGSSEELFSSEDSFSEEASVVVVVAAPGRALADRLILGPGLKGLTPPPPIRALALVVVLDTSDASSSSVSAGAAVVVRPLGLALNEGLGRREGLEGAEVLFDVSSSPSSAGAAVVRVRDLGAPNLLRPPMLG